jgi:ribonuclease HII
MPAEGRAIAGVNDSKQLTAAQRSVLAVRIRERAVAISLGAASAREIDRFNVYHATVLAMRRALRRLRVVPDHVIIDGRPIRTLEIPHVGVIGGDRRCFSVACASIVAKVTRDRLMHALGRRHAAYGWDRNVGYGTPVHWSALDAVGRCAHHRGSFLTPWQLALELEPAEAAVAQPVVDEAMADDLFTDGLLTDGLLTEDLATPGAVAGGVPSQVPPQLGEDGNRGRA